MNRTRTGVAAVLLLALTTAGCRNDTAGSAATVTTQGMPQLVLQNGHQELAVEDASRMTYFTVRRAALPGRLETTGKVTFDDRHVSTIVSRVQGRIENTRSSLWDAIRRGDPIVELYSPDFMTAQAEYIQAKAVTRISIAAGPDNSGDLAAEMMEAGRRKLELLGMDRADIAAIRAPSPTTWIRAPISGTVVQNQAVIGMAVNPGDVLYQLGTLDHVWITADIYEVDLALVRVGETLQAVTMAFPDQVFRGVIQRVSPVIDPDAHTAEIRCEVQNPGLKLKPQMLARIQIATSPRFALVVPQNALVFDDDSYYAFVEVAPGRFQRHAVHIGSWNEQGNARVISGLAAGDQVAMQSLKLNALWHEARGESY